MGKGHAEKENGLDSPIFLKCWEIWTPLGIQTAGWNPLPQHREAIITSLSTHQKQPRLPETSKAVQWLRPRMSTAGGSGLIPGCCTKIPQAVWHGPKNKKKTLLSSASRENQTTITPALLQSWYIGMTQIPTSSYLGQDWAVATWMPSVPILTMPPWTYLRAAPTSRNRAPYLGITGGFSDTHVGSLGRVRWGP